MRGGRHREVSGSCRSSVQVFLLPSPSNRGPARWHNPVGKDVSLCAGFRTPASESGYWGSAGLPAIAHERDVPRAKMAINRCYSLFVCDFLKRRFLGDQLGRPRLDLGPTRGWQCVDYFCDRSSHPFILLESEPDKAASLVTTSRRPSAASAASTLSRRAARRPSNGRVTCDEVQWRRAASWSLLSPAARIAR